MQIFDLPALNESLARLQVAFKAIGERGFPATSESASRASAFIQQTWVGFASGQPIPGLDRTVNNAEYRSAIQRRKVGPFNWLIFVPDDIGDKIEEDRGPVDLKKHLPFKKSYFAKDGHPYSIIPFRHKRADIQKTLGSQGMGDTAKKLLTMEKSYVTGSRMDSRGIKRFTYQWAQRDKETENKLKAKAPRMAGMVRFDTSTGKGKSSAYMTFRVISTNSPADSWIIPAYKGIDLTSIVARTTEKTVGDMVMQGIKNDLAVLGNGKGV